jgi:hypothetical protein
MQGEDDETGRRRRLSLPVPIAVSELGEKNQETFSITPAVRIA